MLFGLDLTHIAVSSGLQKPKRWNPYGKRLLTGGNLQPRCDRYRLEFLEGKDDFLSPLNSLVDWEWFRDILEGGKKKSNVGRPAYDVILMFKLLVLQSLYNLSDEQVEYQANDRLSFHAFLNITVFDKVPDATTIWLFREWLTKKELVKVLFDKLDEMLGLFWVYYA